MVDYLEPREHVICVGVFHKGLLLWWIILISLKVAEIHIDFEILMILLLDTAGAAGATQHSITAVEEFIFGTVNDLHLVNFEINDAFFVSLPPGIVDVALS